MSWKIRLRSGEAYAPQPFLSPDLVIKESAIGVVIDFDVAKGERGNAGGLRSKAALHTSIIIQLFTDARARDGDVLPDVLDPDPRGWWGDGGARAKEQGVYDLGSRLWLYRRSVLNQDTIDKARDAVVECLQPLIDQGAVASFEVITSGSYHKLDRYAPETGILEITVRGYARDGSVAYDSNFQVLWDSLLGR
jgi:phage gp46-like protein